MHPHCNTSTAETRICEYCSNAFLYIPHKSGKGRFCCRDCGRKGQSQRITVLCQHCQQPFEVKRCNLAKNKGKYCSNACYKAHGRTIQPIEQRFWSKVHKTDTCWLWTDSLNRAGYGRLQVHTPDGKKLMLAHRFSYEMHYGDIPGNEEVCHHCDNPQCVRPDHLFLGSHLENVQDMIAKNRHAYGEKAPWSKLTEEVVIEIRQRYEQGNVLQRQLAQEYGLCQATVGEIVRRVIWKHLP